MSKYIRLLVIILLFLCSYEVHAFEFCDLESVNYVSAKQFNEKIKKYFRFNKIQWIDASKLVEETPTQYDWVGEGHAGHMIKEDKNIHGLATTGLLTCTGVTAFTKAGYLALAHITDLTPPLEVKKFLKEVNADLERPITIIGKTLNDRHLLNVKEIVEEHLDVTSVVKTLPILCYKDQVTTCLKKDMIKNLQKDLRGISFCFTKDGNHKFFFQPQQEQKKINHILKSYDSSKDGYEKLFITPLPYWLLTW